MFLLCDLVLTCLFLLSLFLVAPHLTLILQPLGCAMLSHLHAFEHTSFWGTCSHTLRNADPFSSFKWGAQPFPLAWELEDPKDAGFWNSRNSWANWVKLINTFKSQLKFYFLSKTFLSCFIQSRFPIWPPSFLISASCSLHRKDLKVFYFMHVLPCFLFFSFCHV